MISALLASILRPHQKFSPDVLSILKGCDRLTLYSLDPEKRANDTATDTITFHKFANLGQTEIVGNKAKSELIAALQRGMDENSTQSMMCFNPRHGIRATRGDESVDILICFECLQMEVFTGKSRFWYRTSGTPQTFLDSLLTDAKVKLAPKPGETAETTK